MVTFLGRRIAVDASDRGLPVTSPATGSKFRENREKLLHRELVPAALRLLGRDKSGGGSPPPCGGARLGVGDVAVVVAAGVGRRVRECPRDISGRPRGGGGCRRRVVDAGAARTRRGRLQ